MNIHSIDLADYRAKSRGNSVLYLGTAGSHGNEQLQVTLGDGWTGLTIQAIFHPSEVAVQLPANGLLDVPWEATEKPLTAIQGRIVFQGFNQDRLVNTIDLAYTVAQHSSAVGRDERPYTPGIVEGVLNRMAADKEEILNAAQQADQAKNTVQQTLEKVENAAANALNNIAAAAPALPAVSAAHAGQAVTVKSDGSGYQLTGPFLSAEAGICPTVNGNPAVCNDSIAWNIQGLKVFGGSRQDGIPSPDHPVPIVNAGASGSIILNITDGADQNQTLRLFTPNALLGIPVKQGGNYTDQEGKQWICDIKNFTDGKYYQNIVSLNSIVFDLYKEKSNSREFVKYNLPHWSTGSNIGMSTKFVCEDADRINTFSVWETTLYVRLAADTTMDEANRIVSDAIFLYATSSPAVTQIPSEEQTAYSAMTTYADTTLAATSEPVAGIEVQYIANGTKYLKSVTDRIAALEQAELEREMT